MFLHIFDSSCLFRVNEYHRFASASGDGTFDSIEEEIQHFHDPEGAADWLESEGYDPKDFDL